MKIYLVRVSGLMESPYSFGIVPFETTYVEKFGRFYVKRETLERNLREKWEQKGFNVLWIWELKRKMI